MKKRFTPIRFRFSLASFLLAVAVVSVCIVLGARVNEAHKQERAVALIEKLPGQVMYDYQVDENGDTKYELGAGGVPVGLAQPPWIRRQLERLGAEDVYMIPVVEVTLRNPGITDDDLMPLRDLPRLRTVSIFGPRITDEGLKHLSSATDLERLDLIQTQETDATLRMCATFRSLRDARFSSPNITDEGVRHLRGLPRLRYLNLQRSQVTDRGLEHLATMHSMEMLVLARTQVTDAGVAKLQKSLPKCSILR